VTDDPAIGQKIGNIRLVEQIGHGAMGVVYRAEHLTLGTPYAVKILHARWATRSSVVERFRREALACARLKHPNVVFITDFGFKKELGIYIAMEYLDGQPLSKFLRGRRIPPHRAAAIPTQIAEALEAAHQLGIIHRDLKSENIVRVEVPGREDFVKVLDFGIAQLKWEDEQLTAAGTVLGSPHYMAPEQIQGFRDQIGPQTDIYALGILMYEMLAGALPFRAAKPIEICRKHLMEIPARLDTIVPALAGTQYPDLVAQMLAKDPKDRPATMRQMVELLRPPAPKEQRTPDLDTAAQARVSRLISKSAGPLRELFKALPGILDLDESLLRDCLWGVLQRDFLDAPKDTDRFTVAVDNIRLLVEVTLEHGAVEPSGLFRSLGELLRTADAGRSRALVEELAAFRTNPMFPEHILSGWFSDTKASGTWMAVPNRTTSPVDDGLVSILKRPLSVKSVKDLLVYDVNPFKRGKDE
jgi:serine/threonine protein kinase